MGNSSLFNALTEHVMVLGCTGGARQTMTALMMGHTFASIAGSLPSPSTSIPPRRAGAPHARPLLFGHHARCRRCHRRAGVVPYTDQLVLVVPASSDAARAEQMTFEWLDGHWYDELRARSVTVVNGVSRRSMGDVAHAESGSVGEKQHRCQALVRIPWDDHLAWSPRGGLKSLRGPTRRAYLALAGIVAGVPDRYQAVGVVYVTTHALQFFLPDGMDGQFG